MKKHVETKEQKLNRIRKSERGSITLFVLIAMIFFLTVGIAVYISNVNNSTAQQRDVKKIQSEYNSTGNVNQIYNDQKDKLDQKLFITVRDVDGNIYQDGTWINGNKYSAFKKTPLTVEVTWPDGIDDNQKYITKKIGVNEKKISAKEPVGDIEESCTISATLNGKTSTVEIKVDKLAPEITIDPNDGTLVIDDDTGNLMKSPTITATDSESGIEKVQYAWVTDKNQLPADSEWANLEGATGSITKEITDSSIEKYYLCVKATDKVGNETFKYSEEYQVKTIEQIKNTLTISQTPEEWTNEDVTVTINYGDLLTDIKRYGFGVDETTARDDAFSKVPESENPLVISIPENGFVYAYGQNITYSIEAPKTHEITNIDKVKPKNTIPTAVSTLNTITVTFTQTDELSGIDPETIQYAIRKTGDTTWTIVNDSEKVHTFTELEKDMTYEVKTIAQDKAGNKQESEVLEVNTMILTGPGITHTPTSITNENVTVTITAPDLEEGAVVKYSLDGTTYNNLPSNPYIFEIDKNQTIYAITEIASGDKSDVVTDEVANIDKLLPIVNSITASRVATNQGVTIEAKAKDAIETDEYACSGIIAYMFSQETDITKTSDGWQTIDLTEEEITKTQEVTENGTWYFYVKDAAGNVNTAGNDNKIVIDNIDKTLPTISVTPENSTVNKFVNITITATDEGGSGLIDNTQYKYNLGTSRTDIPTGDFKTYENGTAFEIGTDLTGTYYLWVQEVQDNAQNVSTSNGTKQGTYHVFGPYVFDNSVPNVRFEPNTNTTYAKQQTSKVTIEDIGTAGVDAQSLKYKWVEEGENEPEESSITSTFANGQNITENTGLTGKYYLWVLAQDTVGNKQKVKSDVFYLDNTLPTTTAPVKKVATSSTITVEFKQTDLHSEIDTSKISYGIKQQAETDWTWVTDSNSTHKFTKLLKETTYQIRTKVTDNAGNGEALSEIIEVATEKLDIPVISISPETPINDKVTVTVTYPEIDGCKYKYSEDGENWIDVTLVDGSYTKDITENKTIYAKIIDENEQTSEVATHEINNIDKLKPTVTIAPNGENYVLNPGETSIKENITITAADTGTSGLNKLQYAISSSNSQEPTSWIDFNNGSVNEITLEGGNNYIWLNVIDFAGNRSETTISNVFKVDYKIEYDANGGENAPEAQTKEHGNDLTLSSVAPTWEGHTFIGWATTRKCTGSKVYARGPIHEKFCNNIVCNMG